jgi:hypothetical protein
MLLDINIIAELKTIAKLGHIQVRFVTTYAHLLKHSFNIKFKIFL